MSTETFDTTLTCQSSRLLYEELLENCNQDPAGFFGRIVTRDETWICHYGSLNQQEAKSWKKPGEETPTRP